jgi:hypothetical protein
MNEVFQNCYEVLKISPLKKKRPGKFNQKKLLDIINTFSKVLGNDHKATITKDSARDSAHRK